MTYVWNDVIFHEMVDNFETAGFSGIMQLTFFYPFAIVKQNFTMSFDKNYFQDFTPCNFIYRYLVTPCFLFILSSTSFAINLPKISKIYPREILEKITILHSIETHVKSCSTQSRLFASGDLVTIFHAVFFISQHLLEWLCITYKCMCWFCRITHKSCE